MPSPDTAVVADAGERSQANLEGIAERKVQTWIADPEMRARDERFADQAKHKAKGECLHDKGPKPGKVRRFGPAKFRLAEERSHCTCPAGERLDANGSNCTTDGYANSGSCGAECDLQYRRRPIGTTWWMSSHRNSNSHAYGVEMESVTYLGRIALKPRPLHPRRASR